MVSIAVIGAGIVGVQIARELQCKGEEVTLFDYQEPGQGTSFGNAGYIATEEILPLAHSIILKSLPSILFDPLGPVTFDWRNIWRLVPWCARYLKSCTGDNSLVGIDALATLQNKAREAWIDVISREKISALIRSNGSLKVFETESGFARTKTERELQLKYGIDWHVEKGEQIWERVPELGHKIKYTVFYPNGMNTVSPSDLTRAIFQNFINDGGNFIKTKIKRLEMKDAPVLIAEEQARTVKKVVVSCGYLSAALLEPLGVKVPLVAERGYHIEMEHEKISFDMPIGSYERGCYLTPMKLGLRVAGTSEIVPVKNEPGPKWLRAEILSKHAKELLPGVVLNEKSRWMGRRPTLPDFLPMLGPVPGLPAIFAACGHHHLGLTLSAITASSVSGSLLRGCSAAIPVELSPGRFT